MIRTGRKLNSVDVVDALTDLFILRGPPTFIRSDNGPLTLRARRCATYRRDGEKPDHGRRRQTTRFARIAPRCHRAWITLGEPRSARALRTIANRSTPASATSCSTAKSSSRSGRQPLGETIHWIVS